jgi:hypothetical protein
MRIRLILPLFFIASNLLLAQNVSIDNVEIAGDKIIVHYSLEDANPANEYQLNLYSSNDNFRNALTKVSGNVGNEVKPGKDRKIEWKVVEELGTYKGKIALEIRGRVFVPFVKLQNFDVSKKYKRGKPMNIGWKAGATNPINVELIKGSERVMGENNLQNSGTHTLYIPSSAKPGKDYRLKITDTKTNDVVFTNNFAVAPKIPLLLKVLPVLAVGGAAVALAGGSSKKDSGGTLSELPNPPLPGN